MRPDIRISYQLHGELKDFAKAEGMEISAAYILVLRRGLENDGGKGDE